MDYPSVSILLFIMFIRFCKAQKDPLPDLQSLDLFKDHPMDIGSLLPDSLLADSSIPTSLISNKTIKTPKMVSMSARKPGKTQFVFSMKNVKPSKPFIESTNVTSAIAKVNRNTPSTFNISKSLHSVKPERLPIDTTSAISVKSQSPKLDIAGKVVHEFLPKTVWTDMKTQPTLLSSSNTLKDSFNIAESSVLLSDVFKQPWGRYNFRQNSFILPRYSSISLTNIHKKSRKNRLRKIYGKQISRQQNLNKAKPSIQQLTDILKRENTLLNLALGLIKKDTILQKALVGGKNKCPYKPYRKDKRFFMELVKDGGWMKRRCALGTAYTQETCECSINLGYQQPEECTPEVIMDFNNGIIADKSPNEIPCGVEGVTSLSDLAYFNGASRIILWRYTNFDFQKAITLKFRFKSESKLRSLPHPLISNCGTGRDEPSFGVVLHTFSDVLAMFVKTKGHALKFVTFKINPMEWNDVIYSYDGEHLTGKVNGLENRESAKGNIEIRSAEMTIGHCERYGYFKGFMDNVKIYSCAASKL